MEKEKNTQQNAISDLLNDLKLSRRSFVKATAATGAALALGAGLSPDLRALAQIGKAAGADVGQWIPSTCQGCTSWCSKEVYVVDGRAIKVHGNKRSKVNGSASCPRAHLALQQVYDPDRIKVPMKRTNPKKGRGEDPKFVPISWDEALDTIARFFRFGTRGLRGFANQTDLPGDLSGDGAGISKPSLRGAGGIDNVTAQEGAAAVELEVEVAASLPRLEEAFHAAVLEDLVLEGGAAAAHVAVLHPEAAVDGLPVMEQLNPGAGAVGAAFGAEGGHRQRRNPGPGVRPVRPLQGELGQHLPLFSGGGESVLFCADLVPTSAHFPAPYIMAYDLDPVRSMDEKTGILGLSPGLSNENHATPPTSSGSQLRHWIT